MKRNHFKGRLSSNISGETRAGSRPLCQSVGAISFLLAIASAMPSCGDDAGAFPPYAYSNPAADGGPDVDAVASDAADDIHEEAP